MEIPQTPERCHELTINEYAELKRVTRRTVERWIQRRLIEAERIGPKGHWRIKVTRAA